MRRVVAIFVFLATFLSGGAVRAGPMEDAAAARSEWALALSAGDVGKLVSMYTPDVLFYGPTAALYKDQEGVRTYLAHLPPGLAARMGEQGVVAIEPNVLLSSGLVDIIRKDG